MVKPLKKDTVLCPKMPSKAVPAECWKYPVHTHFSLYLAPTNFQFSAIIKLKNYFRHHFQRSRSHTSHLLYQLFTQIFSSHLTLHRNNKWSTFLSSLHPQAAKFWKVVRYFTKSSSQIPPLLHQGTQVYQSAHKAEVLAQILERAQAPHSRPL